MHLGIGSVYPRPSRPFVRPARPARRKTDCWIDGSVDGSWLQLNLPEFGTEVPQFGTSADITYLNCSLLSLSEVSSCR